MNAAATPRGRRRDTSSASGSRDEGGATPHRTDHRPLAALALVRKLLARAGLDCQVRRRPRPSRRTARSSGPGARSARRWVPASITSPCSSTTIMSARRIVDSRCATTNAVRSREQRLERLLDAGLGRDVDARGRLVQDQDARVGQQRPRERDQLALADREPGAALLDRRCRSPSGSASMNSSAPTASAAAPDRPRAVASGRPNAMFSRTRAREEEALLRHDPELPAQRRHGDVAQVVPVDRDAPAGRVVEAGEQLDDRRLARAGVARRARPSGPASDRERDAVQHLRAALARRRSGRRRTRPRPAICGSSRASGASVMPGSVSSTVEDLVERRRRRQERLVELRELLHRVEEVRQQPDEHEEAARCELARRTRARRRSRAPRPSRAPRAGRRTGSRSTRRSPSARWPRGSGR